MNTTQQPPSLATIFSEVLAGMAFLCVDEETSDPLATPCRHWIQASIGYHGAMEGMLTMHCPREFALELATNLLGISADDPQADAKSLDAVRELMNIVCGQFVTTHHGTQAVFDLTVPKADRTMQMPDWLDDGQGGEVVSVNGLPIRLTYCPNWVTAA